MIKSPEPPPSAGRKKPDWLKVRFPVGENYRRIERYHSRNGLNSVCRSAACPNQGECWNQGTATFMILGNRCTRTCRFCNVTSAVPSPPDPEEADKVATAVSELQLRHAVITSVTRDDLEDGGAQQFVALVQALRKSAPECAVELLIPDFRGDARALALVVNAGPDVLGHNLETVPRLYPAVRPEADYQRSLQLLSRVRQQAPEIVTKSGLMLGMGEQQEEIQQVLRDLRDQGCRLVTLGQYLAPTRDHYPVARYVPPEEFEDYAHFGRTLGFDHVEAGPLVRSSYHAEEQHNAVKER